ncbi:hypothetical protein ACERII_24095 [Evansella sp. AB-rgal1]|uniref:hypothetical protein n=1 Tax=Evansella sp. AB-rgal1 TaxID=3242696 RepID=UPI00359CE92F
MSRIQVRVYDVLRTNNQLGKQRSKLSSTRGQLTSVSNSIDRKITARRNIGGRLNNIERQLRDLERKLHMFEQFVNHSMASYQEAERRVERYGRNYILSSKPIKSSNLNKFKELKARFSTTATKRVNSTNIKDASYLGKVFHVLSSGFLSKTFNKVREDTIKRPMDWVQRNLQKADEWSKKLAAKVAFNVLSDGYLREQATNLHKTMKDPDLKWY